MDIETKIDLIKQFAEEIVTEKELRELFEAKDHPVAYDGFEPSGIAPIHFGLLRALNLKLMLKAGIKFKLYLADYFALINNKIGGDLEKIKTVGNYFIEIWKAAGIDLDKVEVIWASDIINNIDYWDKTLRIAKELSLERIMRSITIMGRKMNEKVSVAQLFYPPMQVNDVFYMNIDICQLGMDQRKASMLAREVAEKMKWKKPVAVHHHILLGLQGIKNADNPDDVLIASKMSKSDPKSAIYVHDDFETIKQKINNAYCPIKQEQNNPILEYYKYLVFKEKSSIIIQRPGKFGGDVSFESYNELSSSYIKGDLHPQDLKNGISKELNDMIKPIREYFEKNKSAKELYEKVKSFQITK
ncbi:MAG: tyrosine--tRNA ligase [Candidatus Marsarchaeota archaeon]|nr:tyrosine--tRNA ligase [Candidatus Marsarchaeota archaeon]MCL5094678.1 tyrosine--tRNA ligase [Candidatus Marsarchaeota archaeon]